RRLRLLLLTFRFAVLFRYFRQRGNLVAFIQVHDAHALRVATDDANFVDVRAVDHALRSDQHDVVVVADGKNADHWTVTFRGTDVAHPFAPAALLAIAHRRSIFGTCFAFALWTCFAWRRASASP